MDPAHLQILHQDTANRGRPIQNTTRGLTDDVEKFEFYEVLLRSHEAANLQKRYAGRAPGDFPNILRQGNVGQSDRWMIPIRKSISSDFFHLKMDQS